MTQTTATVVSSSTAQAPSSNFKPNNKTVNNRENGASPTGSVHSTTSSQNKNKSGFGNDNNGTRQNTPSKSTMSSAVNADANVVNNAQSSTPIRLNGQKYASNSKTSPTNYNVGHARKAPFINNDINYSLPQQQQQLFSPIFAHGKNKDRTSPKSRYANSMSQQQFSPTKHELSTPSQHTSNKKYSSPVQVEGAEVAAVPNPFGGGKYQEPPPVGSLPLPPMQWTISVAARNSSSSSSSSSSGSPTPTSRSPIEDILANASAALTNERKATIATVISNENDFFTRLLLKSTSNRLKFDLNNNAPTNSLNTSGSNPVSCHA
jgi:hypothetical protein